MHHGPVIQLRNERRTWHHRVGIRITAAARRLLNPVEFRNDHGERCTCLECVMRRIEAAR